MELVRATVDRPDEREGFQVHVLYAVPSDGTDRRLDVDGSIVRSVRGFNEWLGSQSGGRRLRIDTHGGVPDITFHRLPRTDAAYAEFVAFIGHEVQKDLVAGGFTEPRKVYAVYYDGGNSTTCGAAAWPPTVKGRFGTLYLRGTPRNAPPCAASRVGAPGGPGYQEWSMLHEIVHTLGYVAACAPNHHRAGHASDETRDLM